MSSPETTINPNEFKDAALAVIKQALAQDNTTQRSLLAEAGLFGICAHESQSGMGLTIDYALPIAEVAGQMQLSYPLLDVILVAKHLAEDFDITELISGQKTVTVAWGVHTNYVDISDFIFIISSDGAQLFNKDQVIALEDSSLDPANPQYSLQVKEDQTPLATLSKAATNELLQDALLVYSSYLNGLSAEAIARTANYVSQRTQFGRPLSSKQAIRHNLAQMQLQHEMTKASLLRALKKRHANSSLVPFSAFSSAITACIFTLEKAIHLHGGMGFTWELPLHFSLRQARKIEAAFNHSQGLKNLGSLFIQHT